jgi:dolichyl-phosphate-mannose--protein O-mannosyl transferase
VEASEDGGPNKLFWTRLDTISITLLGTIAAVLRAIGLETPTRGAFDEPFYTRDACWYVHASQDLCRVRGEANLEHPPLGKWFIALGEAGFGNNSVGWRVSSVIAGVLSVVVIYLLARKLLRSTFAATFAAGLLTVDFLHFVHSRIAMLDIYIGLFILIAFTCMAWDRDHLLEGRRRLRERPWRAAAGVAAGLAISVKWTGVLTLAGLVVMSLAWELWARKPASRRRALLGVIRTAGPGLVVAFVVIPTVIYVTTHIGRVHGAVFALPWEEGSWFENFIDRQQYALRYHIDLVLTNPYSSPPWWWLLLKRGIAYQFDNAGGVYRQLTGAGSPLVWWLSIPALIATTVIWFRRNTPERPEGLVLAGFYWNYLPWIAFAGAGFLLGSSRSAVFIFYVVPLLPFMIIAMASFAQKLWERVWGKGLVALFMAGVIGLFAFYYPILTYRPLTRDQWRARIWIFNACGRPDRAPLTVYEVTTVNGTPTTKSDTIEKGKQYLPPTGFCWIQMRLGQTKIDLDSLFRGSL